MAVAINTITRAIAARTKIPNSFSKVLRTDFIYTSVFMTSHPAHPDVQYGYINTSSSGQILSGKKRS
jgi:hypothetical protein